MYLNAIQQQVVKTEITRKIITKNIKQKDAHKNVNIYIEAILFNITGML